MAPPVGPTGVISCSGDGHPDRPADAGVRVGLGYSHSWTDLAFHAGPDVAIARDAVVVTGDKRLTRKSSVQIGAGGAPSGSMTTSGSSHSIGPGWLLFGSLTYRILDGQKLAPFVLASFSFGASAARTVDDRDRTRSAHLYAIDFRAGLTVGKTFWDVVSPYVAARVFGGPVLWKFEGNAVLGTDKYHYQPAVGAVLSLGPADVFAEWAFLGERALGAGVGVSF